MFTPSCIFPVVTVKRDIKVDALTMSQIIDISELTIELEIEPLRSIDIMADTVELLLIDLAFTPPEDSTTVFSNG